MLLKVNNLRTYFYIRRGIVKAVDGVSFSLDRGETLAIVGESGSGKTVTALSLLKLIPVPPGKIVEGEVFFEGENILGLSEKSLQKIRGNRIAMIFQDPTTSLNPVFTIGNQIMEAILTHQKVCKKEAREKTIKLLEMVGISQAEDRLNDYPHQFSGGMRQRVMIAMALSCKPDILIADEPTTALDVTIQAQILELISSLQKKFNSATILITHDLGIVAGLADKILVMYAGRPVEYADVDSIYYNSHHPYTLGLMSSIARLDKSRKEKLQSIKGSPPSLIDVPPGCGFHPRCKFAMDICQKKVPEFIEIEPGHFSACHQVRNAD
ncbi:ABC transporter ATP-binding protein [Candidatus Oleimmundimicrobium sp.]|uniref:ABC transporter ATP-binding protein n=1 Tax=Candidatus Oleimmundimicrobium sp. TaxID=3060597 RepID=UPI0027232F95|nr:ABC transporter ATP-binding protein [Candidatus Oleimmundimicrobium sp.]MDO8885290.1 ABC transporter ATP-binding protein [Candidatus Oleimmundimicrobium sp.]